MDLHLPFEALAPLLLSDGLVRALYEGVGLPFLHLTLLLGAWAARPSGAG